MTAEQFIRMVADLTPYRTGHPDDPAEAIEFDADDALESMNSLIGMARCLLAPAKEAA